MTHLSNLQNWLFENSSERRYLFLLSDLKSLFPHMSDGAFKTLLCRAVQKKILEKVCRNVFGFNIKKNSGGQLLFHVVAQLRSSNFNYISLETILSEEGIISQIPQNRIFIMSTGRSQVIDCNQYGSIEVVHSKSKFNKILKHLVYDSKKRLWKGDIHLAIKDMKKTKRNTELIQWGMIHDNV
ncbi:MAG: hypothetical protein HEEMFOPI_01460 [Holosporales bacterium]